MSEMKLKGLLMKLKKLKNYKFLFFVNVIIFVLFFSYNTKACSNINFSKKDIFIIGKYNNQKIKFRVEIADTDQKRKTGLQCRTKMELNEGMLFIWKTEDFRSFWMKNTSIPLDIIFFNEAYEIIDISFNAKPFSLKSISSEKKAKYVLELNEGVFDSYKLDLKDKIIINK